MRAGCLWAALVDRAVHAMRHYDPQSASTVVRAMGELGVRDVSSPQLLAQLTPTLHRYTHGQLTVLLEGMSLLRASHAVLTAHLLHRFLMSLRANRGARCAGGGGGAVSSRSLTKRSRYEEVTAMASMARVLQQHHTQRTLRAFLAAADRALARPSLVVDGHGGLEGGVRTSTGTRSSKLASARLGPAVSLRERHLAVQMLYLVEVYVNSGICVAAPHTPLWLRHMLLRWVPFDAFTPREMLHLHNRLFGPGGSPTSIRGAETCSDLHTLYAQQNAFLVRWLLRGTWAGVEWDAACVAQADTSREIVSGSSSEGVDGWAERRRNLRAALTEEERSSLLRCLVVYEISRGTAEFKGPRVSDACSLDGDRAGELDGAAAAAAKEACLLASAAAAYRLTREFCLELRSTCWLWWLAVLTTEPETVGQEGTGSHRDFTLTAALDRDGDETLRCICLLQLLHTWCVTREGGQRPWSVDAPPRVDGDDDEECVCATLAALCARLPRCCSSGFGNVEQDLVLPQRWTLLLLLLGTSEHGSRCGSTAARRAPFDRALEKMLMQCQDGDRLRVLWQNFGAARDSAVCNLAAQWMHWWTRRPYTGWRAYAFTRTTTDGDDDELCVHWAIAIALDEIISCPSCQLSGWEALLLNSAAVHAAFSALVTGTTEVFFWDFNHTAVGGATVRTAKRCGLVREKLAVDLLFFLVQDVCRERSRGSAGCDALADHITRSYLLARLCQYAEAALMEKPVGKRGGAQVIEERGVGSRCASSLRDVRELLRCWRQRMWWVTDGTPVWSHIRSDDAVAQLLWSFFACPKGSEACAAASVVAAPPPRITTERPTWLRRLLLVYLQQQAAQLDRHSSLMPASVPTGSAAGVCVSAEALQQLRARLSEQIVDGVRQQPLRPFSAASGSPYGAWLPEPPGTAHGELRQPRPFVPQPSGAADNVMSSIESLHSSTGSAFLSDTLQDTAPMSVAAGSLWRRKWYRDDCAICLTHESAVEHVNTTVNSADAKLRDGYQLSHEATTHHSPCLEGRVSLAEQRVTAVADGEVLLARVMELLKVTRAALHDCATAAEGSLSTEAPGAQHMRAELYRLLSRYGDHLVVLYARCRSRVVGGPPPTVLERQAESMVLQSLLEKRGTSRPPSPSSPSYCARDGDGGFCSGGDRDCETDRTVMELVLPLLWGELHGADPRHSTLQPAAAAASYSAGAGDDVLDVRRAHVFLLEWTRHLPLSDAFLPSQRRLLQCLQACTAHTRLPADGPDELRGCVSALESTVRGFLSPSGQTSADARPFFFLSDMLGRVAERAERRHGAVDETSRSASGCDVQELSALDVYVRCLLDQHPFSCDGDWRDDWLREGRAARLVAVTWLHVLVIHSLCTHHPPVIQVDCAVVSSPSSDEEGGCSQERPLGVLLSNALHNLRDLEQNLLRARTDSGCGTDSESSEPEKQRVLLLLCMVREFSSALAALNATFCGG